MSDEFEDFFKETQGGGGAPSYKFNGVGSGVKGTVVDQLRTVVTAPGKTEPKLDKNGKQQPQLNVTLQTELRNWDKVTKVPTDQEGNELAASEDTGLRRVYIKYQMARAVGDAIRGADATKLEPGGVLAIKQSGTIPVPGQPNDLPEYEARYKKPEPKGDGDDFFHDQKSDEPKTAPSTALADEPASTSTTEEEPPF